MEKSDNYKQIPDALSDTNLVHRQQTIRATMIVNVAHTSLYQKLEDKAQSNKITVVDAPQPSRFHAMLSTPSQSHDPSPTAA